MDKETYIDGDKTILNTEYYLYLLEKENQNISLQQQLEEKDKVIYEMLDFISNDDCPASVCWLDENFNNEIKKLCDCDNCQDYYKKCWLKYFKNEILERGKNGK